MGHPQNLDHPSPTAHPGDGVKDTFPISPCVLCSLTDKDQADGETSSSARTTMTSRIKLADTWKAGAVLLMVFFGCVAEEGGTSGLHLQESGPMNVLFVVADDLNCALGHTAIPSCTHPIWTAWPKSGVHQYPLPVSAVWTVSRLLHDGLYADQTRIRKNNVYLRSAVPDVVTLSQRFRQRDIAVHRGFSTMTTPVHWNSGNR